MVKLIKVSLVKFKPNLNELPGTICELPNNQNLAIKTVDNKFIQIEIALFDEGYLGISEPRKTNIKPYLIFV
jgi:hypothetical protein